MENDIFDNRKSVRLDGYDRYETSNVIVHINWNKRIVKIATSIFREPFKTFVCVENNLHEFYYLPVGFFAVNFERREVYNAQTEECREI